MSQSWVKRTSKTQAFKTVVQIFKYDVSIILFTDENIFTYSGHNEKPTEWPTVCTSAEKKDVIKRLRTQSSFSQWKRQSASNKWLTLHQFDTCRKLSITKARLVKSISRNMMLLWSPYVRSQTSSLSFNRTVPRRTRRFRQSTFPTSLLYVEWF